MSDSELWSVALAADNIQTMTLDQLDSAYQRGIISENTLIWSDGMDNWQKLGEVLGEDEPAPQPAPPRAVAAVAPQAPVQRAAVSAFPHGSAFPPVVTAPTQRGASVAPQASLAPQAAMSLAPQAAMSLPPNSVSPVALNLDAADFDIPDNFGTKKTKWGWIAAASVLVGGVGITAANFASGVPDIDPARAAAAAQPLSAGEQPLSAAEQPLTNAADPNAPIAGGGYKVSAAEEKRFKQEAEKEKELRERAAEALANKPEEPKKPQRQSGGKSYSRPKQAADSPIGKSGSKFDPLNGALP